MGRQRIHWGKKTPAKGRPTPKRAVQEARNIANARKAQADDPNIRRLYEAFAPAPKGR